MKKKSVEPESNEYNEELSPEWKRELRRRIADADDPARYVIFSDITGRGRWRLWLDVSDGVYGMSLDQATLFKRKDVARAVAKAYATGRKNPLHVIPARSAGRTWQSRSSPLTGPRLTAALDAKETS